MTRIRLMSDLHDDYSRAHFGVYTPADDVEADVLVVAGDIAGRLSTQGRDWLEAQRNRLGIPIVVVPGNHDFWKGSLDREIPRFRERLQFDGIHVLDGDAVEVEGVRFVGGTLWTDYAIAGDAVLAAHVATRALNDFSYTTTGVGRTRPRARPQDFREVHIRHREAIRKTLATPFDGPTVVVTHHAPSPKSLRNGCVTEPLDAAYASNLEQIMIDGSPDLWIHGHVHARHDYQVGDTRVICNPRGYVSWQSRFGKGVVDAENERFDERLVVEVGAGMRPRIVEEVSDDKIAAILEKHGRIALRVEDLSEQDMRRIRDAEVSDDDEYHCAAKLGR